MTSADTPITVEDLRSKALHIKDMAEGEVRDLAQEKTVQVVVVGVVAVLAVVSIAYYLGTRRR
ncbi:MAG: hypothetical protein Q7J82_05820 [Coriobacteriia bacterium]|nr:hypothetical protein [Coriobacteriia bacterium]